MSYYCPKCGRELEDGEICACEQESVIAEETGYEEPSAENAAKSFADTAAQTAHKVLDGAGTAFQNMKEQMPKDPKAFRSSLANLKAKLGFGTPESNSLGVYERNRPIVPDCIETNENEVPIKQYNIAVLRSRMKFMRAEGRLQVTNKRVIFRATGRSIVGKTVQQQEFALDHLKGIEVRRDFRFSFLNYLLGALLMSPAAFLSMSIIQGLSGKRGLMTLLAIALGIAALIPFFTLYKKFWLKLAACAFSVSALGTSYAVLNMYTYGRPGFFGGLTLLLAVIAGVLTIICWFMVTWVPNLVIAVKTEGNGATNGAVLIRRKPTFFEYFFHRATGTEEYSGFAEVLPWIDTEVATDEIGALIDDLQKLGDYGIEKWKQPE